MTTEQTFLLGVDGGGTTTTALLGLADGRVIGRGDAGPSNAKAVGTEAAKVALEQAIAGAFVTAGEWPRGRRGVPGRGRVRPSRGPPAPGRVVPGRAVGRPPGAGQRRRPGGGGGHARGLGRRPDRRHRLDRGGSGGRRPQGPRRGLGARLRRRGERLRAGRLGPPPGRPPHRRSRERPFESRSVDLFAVRGPGGLRPRRTGLGRVRAGLRPRRIAGLAPAVLAAAAQDSTVDDLLVRPAGGELAEAAAAAARTLGWTGGDLPLGFSGGFLLSSPVVADALLDGLRDRGYNPSPTRVELPAEGALILARRDHEGG